MVWRLDVALERLDVEACSGIGAGELVDLQHTADSLAACTRGGHVLGAIPAAEAAELGRGTFQGVVRTVKRAEGAAAAVVVRFTRASQAAFPAGQRREVEGQEEEEEGIASLSREQYESLAGDGDVLCMLRDERLQAVVAQVDSAPDREQALLKALSSPAFKEFADKVLLTVASEPP